MSQRKKLLITGASGFIGKALINSLKSKYSIRILTYNLFSVEILKKLFPEISDVHNISNLNEIQWNELFHEVDTIIHCGAQTKPLKNGIEPEQQFMKSNYEATINLAKSAAENGVRRFIFLSSMSVYGNMRQCAQFSENSPLKPTNAYGLSKLRAEQELMGLSEKLEVVIIRPPLIYGPGAAGNFKKLFTLVNKRMPMPLGAIKNKRHFCGINNLIDFINLCIDAEQAKNQAFLISDREAISTTDLVKKISKALNKKNYLIPIPHQILEKTLKFIGMARLADQLLYNIEIDSTKARTLLQWIPPYTLEQELQLSVDHFLQNQ
ncbi:MAG TPA: NAD-dependent epimerase/dehydratase family protein [Legionella sp.]|nr:NAD-dependent epimerase/dehydratase family protein [Legionella sp.]